MLNIFNLFAKDESSNWAPSYKIPLWLNLQTESLNNVRIGDPLEKLQVFGRPDNSRPFKKGRFEYHQLGFEAEGENGRIINFCFMVGDNQAKFANCELTLTTYNGRQLSINRFTTLKEVEQILGAAPEKEFDEDEGYCYDSNYPQGRLSLYFSWLEDGRIEEIIIENREE